ncbi:hypothetical protein AB0C34_17340 [Nocardia sp. NPDC049220]|uniref:hypothetical protein n=1 Tax=Nocardia sp. NPDC049220 TaxID=3155273 RepID=UPI0033ED41DC
MNQVPRIELRLAANHNEDEPTCAQLLVPYYRYSLTRPLIDPMGTLLTDTGIACREWVAAEAWPEHITQEEFES